MTATILKRFVVFGGETWHASGGINDLLGCEDTIEEASHLVANLSTETEENRKIDWWHIVDLETGEICRRSDNDPQDGGVGYEHERVVKYKNGILVSIRDKS